MLEKLFTSRARVKILKLLIFNPEEFHLREMARRTKVSAPYMRKELENLKALNLILESSKGNMRLFKINKSSPIFGELKRIFLKTEVLGDFLKKSLEKNEIKYSLIFGSFASGKESESSDIDVLIIGKINEKELLETIRNAEKETGREINYILWSEKEFQKKAKEKNHLLQDIISKPVIMLTGDENEFGRLVKQ
jgi:predicted nucleotidyltransferase